MNKVFLGKFFFLAFGVISSTAFAFDDSGLPAQQYSGSRAQNNLPSDVKPKVLQGVSITEKLGTTLDKTLTFTDQNGVVKNFSQMLDGKPIILTLNYYRCTTLCSIQLVNLAKSIEQMGWPIGKDFNMVTVSFDPTDTLESSKKAQQDYLSIAHQPLGKWDFYTGSAENIRQLTDQVGYYYKYDPASKEYAHAAAIFFISPNGKISRYLYGINYAPSQIKFSLMDAAQDKIGSRTDQILLTCFHYNPIAGKYDWFAISFLRIAAFTTLVVFGGAIFYFIRRDKKKFKKIK